ncbi:MAG: MFS transporter [Christensenellales bacterium]
MPNRRFLSTSICFLISFLAAALMTVIGPMLAELAEEFHLTLSQSGLMYTAEFAGFTVLIIVCGILADKFGKRIVLTGIFVSLIIALYLFSIIQSFSMALVVMFFAGGSCGPLSSISISIISDLNQNASDKYINFNGVYYGLGAMAGPVIAGICLSNNVPWRTVYLGLSVVCVVVLLLSFLVRIPRTDITSRISFKGIKKIVKDWRYMLVCLSIFFYSGAECSGWGWMSEYMNVNLGFPVLKSSLAIGVFWLSITLGRIATLPILKKVSSRVVVGVLAVGAALSTFASAFVSGEAFAWIIIVLMGLSYSGQFSIMLGQGGKRHLEYSGTSIALLSGTGGISMAVIPALIGVVADNFGVFISQMLPALLFVLLFFVYCFVAKPEQTN